MAAPIKRPVTQQQAPPPPTTGEINFGDLSFYSGGFSLPEGDYALEFSIQMFDGFGTQKKGPQRLGVMITAHPLDGSEGKQVFYSMGGKADQSYAPNPETGKSLVPIPGGPGGGLNDQTNWMMFLKSLYDSGLPAGIFRNDLTVLDGVHVHMVLVPEPEGRKDFKSGTGEATPEQRTPQKIAVVSEIKDDGKPWEGTGGIPAVGSKPATAAKGTSTKSAPASKPNGKPPVPSTDEAIQAAAINGIADALGNYPNGGVKPVIKTATGKAVEASQGADMAQAVLETYFSSDDALNSILGPLGYVASGPMIKLIQ